MNDYATVLKSEQTKLDQSRTKAERNKLGQFATPLELAREIGRAVRDVWGERTDTCSFLEPSIGLGAFHEAFRAAFSPACEAVGYESDRAVASACQSIWAGTRLQVIEQDFTQADIPHTSESRFDIVLANPPYVRHHHLGIEAKSRLQTLVFERTGLKVGGLAGLYIYFFLLADAWMAENGVAAWLIPSEFLDVNYGTVLRRYLTEQVDLIRIHRFIASDTQFDDALVTSAVVIFRKRPPRQGSVIFSLGGSVDRPFQKVCHSIESLRASHKWSSIRDRSEPCDDYPKLGDYFSIRRGIATGANAFFVLEHARAVEQGIPEWALRPILPGARFLKGDIIEAESNGYPLIDKPLALLDCRKTWDQLDHDPLKSYLAQGMASGVDRGYLAAHRSPWYLQESRKPSPFLCTYMGRGSAGRAPFRFLWNKSAAIAANTYLMLDPLPSVQARIDSDPGLAESIFTWLRSLSADQLVRQGRVYGGGLHKLEPKELAATPAHGLVALLG